jgi:hypothetical protein
MVFKMDIVCDRCGSKVWKNCRDYGTFVHFPECGIRKIDEDKRNLIPLNVEPFMSYLEKEEKQIEKRMRVALGFVPLFGLFSFR